MEKWPTAPSRAAKITLRTPRRRFPARLLAAMFPRRKFRATTPPLSRRQGPDTNSSSSTLPIELALYRSRPHAQSLRCQLEARLLVVSEVQSASPPPHPQTVGLYIRASASGCALGPAERGAKANLVSTKNDASPPSLGAMSGAVSRSIATTGTFRL